MLNHWPKAQGHNGKSEAWCHGFGTSDGSSSTSSALHRLYLPKCCFCSSRKMLASGLGASEAGRAPSPPAAGDQGGWRWGQPLARDLQRWDSAESTDTLSMSSQRKHSNFSCFLVLKAMCGQKNHIQVLRRSKVAHSAPPREASLGYVDMGEPLPPGSPLH